MNQIKDGLHIIYPLLAYARYGLLGKRITVIGITGTDGKSSSVVLTANLLRAAGYKTAHFSSVSMHDSESESSNDAKMTTPGRGGLHRFLANAKEKGATHAVVEVTSQGMLQHRHRLIGFSLVGITNITPEHIEAHGGFAAYRRTKLSLIRELLPEGRGVVAPHTLALELQTPVPILSCGMGEGDVSGRLLETSLKETGLALSYGGETAEMQAPLGGPFAPCNMVFAAALALALGIPLATIRNAFARQTPIRGRCEVVSSHPLVIVDYAHTLAALETFLPYVKERTRGKLIHVFGAAGGGRDRYKRPLLAELSGQNADISIVTEENPFDEADESIEADIRAGFPPSHDARFAPRREDALRLARGLAGPEDTILLTGKGSESVIAGPRRSRRAYAEIPYAQCLFGTRSSA